MASKHAAAIDGASGTPSTRDHRDSGEDAAMADAVKQHRQQLCSEKDKETTNENEILQLVRLSMSLRFASAQYTRQQCVQMLQTAQQMTHGIARGMLVDDLEQPSETQEDVDLVQVKVAPPRSFFRFKDKGRMHVPLIDWSAFRGYSLALWVCVDDVESVEGRIPSFQLFRFANASGTLGVEASLTFESGNVASPVLAVRSCAPNSGSAADQKRSHFGAAVVAAIAPAVTNGPSSEWRQVAHRVQLRRREWHLLVVTHSLHYVKKSRVTCFIDGQPQFSEELVYPSGLVQATKSTIGGGSNVAARIASVTMYQEEISKSVVESMFAQGPSVSLFRRWKTAPSGSSGLHMVDLRDSTVLSPFSGPMEDAITRGAALSKLQVVFSFSAVDKIDSHEEDIYADRSVEWIAEGVMGSKGKWVSLENINATSEIQQRNARLGKSVDRQSVTLAQEAQIGWYRTLGVEAVPVVLDYLLQSFEELWRNEDADAAAKSVLASTLETVVIDMLSILRGLLLNQVRNIHEALRIYLLHQLYHVVRRHPRIMALVWTPTSIVACVDVVTSMLTMVPSSLLEGRSASHPTQPSVWSWNPLFGSAVRAWLLDYRVWSTLSYKTQSIYNHQLYRLACEHPKLLNDLNVVNRLLETLNVFFSERSGDGGGGSGGATISTQNTKSSGDVEKEQHWKQQCIHTIMETMEVCLANQSVHVHAALEQEILETTFARASDAATPASPATGPSATGSTSSSPPVLTGNGDEGAGRAAAFAQRRKGGVFFMSLENIIWSDQTASTTDTPRGQLHSEDKPSGKSATEATSALPHVQIRFSLLRDLRAILRFLVTCKDPVVCTALVQLLRRLSVAYLDMRFGLISSSVCDSLLCLLQSFSAAPSSQQNRSKGKPGAMKASSSAEVRMACVPLLIYLLDWLESVEGRTVWCGLEEHLRSILNGEGSFTRGFLELMMEFYFDPVGLSGVQQSIVMNDPTKKESVLFPLSPIHGGKKPHTSSVHDTGIVVMSEDGLRSDASENDTSGGAGGGGLAAWIKLATSFCGKKLSLSWEKRVQVVRMAALRSLTLAASSAMEKSPRHHHEHHSSEGSGGDECAAVMDVYDKGVNGIISLPLKSILPFLPVLLVHTSTSVRDRVLMEISVKLKTDDAHQDHQILLMKKDWVEALLELCVVCNRGSNQEDHASTGTTDPLESGGDHLSAHRSAAYSFDAHKTGEDLVVDAIVSLLAGAMQHPRGWRVFVDLIAALKIMQRKYATDDKPSSAVPPASSIPAVLADHGNVHDAQLLLLVHPLDWLARLTGIVLQKMARSRTILSKVLAENVHKILVLVQEALLSTPHQHCPVETSTSPPQRVSGNYVLSQAQVFLLNAVLDMCTRLVESTHKQYRSGLVPGLQILQISLSYIPASSAALVTRITQLMERAFQQEINPASAVRVYDHLTPRDVFLSALVCLRRALLMQQGSSHTETNSARHVPQIRESLQLLILKLCTSEVFLEDLHKNELTVHVLGDMSERSAVAAVLDALGAAMNDAEMHEREEEADLVPLFPSAKDLYVETARGDDNETTLSQRDFDPDPFAVAFAGSAESNARAAVRTFEENTSERSLWAALEVEENRMLEILKDVATRERKRHERVVSVIVPQRDLWTRRLWEAVEFKFRTQHARTVLPASVVTTILAEYGRRVGLYESSVPGRWRKPLDIDFPITDVAAAVEAAATASVQSEQQKAIESDVRRRRFSMPLEIHGLGSSGRLNKETATAGDAAETTDAENEGQMLLERVGRVVAAQGGGEIQDITIDTSSSSQGPHHLQGEHDSDHGANQTNDDAGSPTKSESNSEPHSHSFDEDVNQPDDANGDEHAGRARIECPGDSTTSSTAPHSVVPPRASSLPAGLWYVDMERHKESGLDPSEGMALAPGEQILAQAKCRRVVPEGMVSGNLYFCAKVLIFVPMNDSSSSSSGSANDEVAPGLRRCWRWKYKHIVAVFLRRFRLRDSAFELFLRNGSTHFLDFPHVVKQQRNELVRLLYSFLPRSVTKQWPGRASVPSLSATTKAWQNRQISNYDYLMALNTYAGRSFNDLTQYPVFPWVLRNYESEVLDLSDPHNFRDLSKPVGALNAERLEEYWERYHSFDDPVIPKFLYGSHYSTCAGVVLFFLVRMQPFADLHRKMQGGTFDLPDRLFYSMQETWNMCNSQMSEVKELTPEFYSDASFLKNLNHYKLGKRHDHRHVEDVMLPKWANGSPEEFVRLHRAALESEHVSQHLHEWIDLIFGSKQRGKAALKANNVFYYLTYYGVVDLDRIEDPFIRESMELQIAHFGQCPMQLFNGSHPKRSPAVKRMGVGSITPTAVANYGQPSTPSDPGSVMPSPSPSANPNPMLTPPGGARSPVAGVSAALASSGAIARPLASMFQDTTESAQEYRRQWSPSVVVKPLARSAIRWIKILPDRFLTVNEVGVVELYNWKLAPKPQVVAMDATAAAAVTAHGTIVDSLANDGEVRADQGTDHRRNRNEALLSPAVTAGVGHATVSVDEDHDDAPALMEEAETEPLSPQRPTCPWLLEITRDDSPFDVVPRIPVFGDLGVHGDTQPASAASHFFPIVASLNGRMIISGGAPNGSLQLRLLDLDNGHVVAKASITGHDAAVTCLSVDRFTYHNTPVGAHLSPSDGEELLVSGSKDSTLAVWRLSRTKPDLLFRPPRISACPIMVLRGHKAPLVDCSINTYLNAVVSCTKDDALVHFLHDDGMVAFQFRASDVHHQTRGATFVNVAASPKGFVVALVRWTEKEEEEDAAISSACVVYNLAGVCVLKKVFNREAVSHMQLSAEGDLVILTMHGQGIIRLCRLDDFVTVQEYTAALYGVDSPICVASFGPDEAMCLAATGHADGSVVLHLLPDADGSVSLLANLRRFLGVNSKLKMVKGTVQQAQNLAWTTLGNAKAVTSTARDIAGEAIGEAKSIVKGFITYLRQGPPGGP